jgi:hypothetical protein
VKAIEMPGLWRKYGKLRKIVKLQYLKNQAFKNSKIPKIKVGFGLTGMDLFEIIRRRDEDLVKTHGPRMRVVPEFSKNYGLLNETSFEKIGGGAFWFTFFHCLQSKKQKNVDF